MPDSFDFGNYAAETSGASLAEIAERRRELLQNDPTPGLSRDQRYDALTRFGLSLLRASADPQGGLARALGTAGVSALDYVAAQRARNRAQQAEREQAVRRYLDSLISLNQLRYQRQQAARERQAMQQQRAFERRLQQQQAAREQAQNQAYIDYLQARARAEHEQAGKYHRANRGGAREATAKPRNVAPYPFTIPREAANQRYEYYLERYPDNVREPPLSWLEFGLPRYGKPALQRQYRQAQIRQGNNENPMARGFGTFGAFGEGASAYKAGNNQAMLKILRQNAPALPPMAAFAGQGTGEMPEWKQEMLQRIN